MAGKRIYYWAKSSCLFLIQFDSLFSCFDANTAKAVRQLAACWVNRQKRSLYHQKRHRSIGVSRRIDIPIS